MIIKCFTCPKNQGIAAICLWLPVNIQPLSLRIYSESPFSSGKNTVSSANKRKKYTFTNFNNLVDFLNSDKPNTHSLNGTKNDS